jgi:DNA-binding transcriptional LysR family regulator
MQGMDWDDLRYLLAVARGGTLAAAARRLGVNQTTVSRRLAAAEASLGLRLFDRIDGLLRPTKAGASAITRAALAEEQVQALVAGIDSDSEPSGLVRLSAVPLLVNRLLIPALPAFCRANPQIRLELVAEPRNVSLSRRETDIALRLSRPEQGAATLTRRIGRLDYAAYGPRDGSGDLGWIGYDEGQRHLPHARWIAAQVGEPAATSLNDAEGILHYIHAGLGKSLLPCRIADQDPRLRRLGPEVILSRDVWLLAHRDLRRQRRIDIVIGWLQSMFVPPDRRSE